MQYIWVSPDLDNILGHLPNSNNILSIINMYNVYNKKLITGQRPTIV